MFKLDIEYVAVNIKKTLTFKAIIIYLIIKIISLVYLPNLAVFFDLISRHPIYFILSLFCFFPGFIFLLFFTLNRLKKINLNDVVVFLFIRLLLSFFLAFIYFEIKNGLVITSFFTIYVDSFMV